MHRSGNYTNSIMTTIEEESRLTSLKVTQKAEGIGLTIATDYWGGFIHPDVQDSFRLFCLEKRNVTLITVSTMSISLWALVDSIAALTINDHPAQLYFAIPELILIGIAFLTMLWIASTAKVFEAEIKTKKMLYNQSNLQSLLLLTMFMILILKLGELLSATSYVCYHSMGLDSRYTIEDSTTPNSNDIPDCPSINSFLSIVSNDVVLVMSLSPLLISTLIYEPRYYLILPLQLILGFLIIFAVVTSYFSFIPIAAFLMVILCFGYEQHRQRMHAFLLQRRLDEALLDKDENSDKMYALEMRSMIGNVAHDLKTPLSSFLTGMDLIQDIIDSSKRHVNTYGISVDSFHDSMESIQNYLKNIRNTNSFMLMTINRCIDFTKASKGMKLTPKNETCILREVLQFPIDCMRNIQERIGIKLEPLAKEICSHIITDKQWLQENLLCLLSNAVKYSSEGEVTIEVSLVTERPEQENMNFSSSGSDYSSRESTNQKGMAIFQRPSKNNLISTRSREATPTSTGGGSGKGYLLFEIEDTGIGISEEAMKSLFSPFKQAQRLAGGTGLGLYSLARRLEALHGSYGVKKRRDGEKGSLFWFAIPYRPDHTMNSTPTPEKADPPSISAQRTEIMGVQDSFLTQESKQSQGVPTTALEILVVDDSPSILKMSSMMLKRQGHKIWTAENGAIALKQIEEKWKETGRGYDLVLMDLQMPVMDGFEATKRLRKEEAVRAKIAGVLGGGKGVTRHQLIFGVSANSDDETMQEALAIGFDDFLGKPFTLEALTASLQHHLNLKI